MNTSSTSAAASACGDSHDSHAAGDRHQALEQRARALAAREAELRPLHAAHLAAYGDGPPYFSAGTAAFWQALDAGRFQLARCGHCGDVHFPPRIVCPDCWAEDADTLIDTPGLGTVVSLTELHVVARELTGLAPLPIALIDLDEGVRVLAWLRDAAGGADPVGRRARLEVERIIGRAWTVARLVP